MEQLTALLSGLGPWPTFGVIAGILLLAALVVHALVWWLMSRLVRRTRFGVDDSLIRNTRGPARLALCLAAVQGAAVASDLSEEIVGHIDHAVLLGWIVTLAWLAIKLTNVLEDALHMRYDLSHADNRTARRVLTQFRVFQRIVVFLTVLLALGAGFMTFEAFRELGVSMLASAGVAGIVIGFAAQKTLANMLAGIQVALTQPIAIDDVVIVEGEWGRIEEIRFTYVVVKIWDLRRLIVPITYFTDHTFQNWTRTTADIMGTVFIYTDHRLPVDDMRAELERICREEAGELWDEKVCVLQVTNASERAMEVRGLVSSPDASMCWSLRCLVREKLIAWLAREHPDALPRLRVETGEMDGQEMPPGSGPGSEEQPGAPEVKGRARKSAQERGD